MKLHITLVATGVYGMITMMTTCTKRNPNEVQSPPMLHSDLAWNLETLVKPYSKRSVSFVVGSLVSFPRCGLHFECESTSLGG